LSLAFSSSWMALEVCFNIQECIESICFSMAPLSSSANRPDHRPELQKHFFPFKTTMMILQNKLECLPRARKWQKRKMLLTLKTKVQTKKPLTYSIKLFLPSWMLWQNKLECLSPVNPYSLYTIFMDKAKCLHL
jgi:hypothetical protein